MQIKYFTSLPFDSCQSVYKFKNKHSGNRHCLVEWINNNQITDVATVDVNNFVVPAQSHELVEFVVNPTNVLSFDQLDSMIIKLSEYSKKYYFIAVNKFLLYSTVDNSFESHIEDFDQKLISHWQKLLKFDLAFSSVQSTDVGTVGNFLYPVTQLALIRS
jgi:hypothetical protein